MTILRTCCGKNQLPDEVIEKILQYVPSVEIVCRNWMCVSRGFSSSCQRVLKRRREYDCMEKHNLWFYNAGCTAAKPLYLHFLNQMTKFQFVHVTHLNVHITTLHDLCSTAGCSLPLLKSLRVRVGGHPPCDRHDGTQSLQPFVQKCLETTCLNDVHLDIFLTSDSQCASLLVTRELCRCISQRYDGAFNVTFFDRSSSGQQWLCPSELTSPSCTSAVAFIRMMNSMRLQLNRIHIVDRLRDSVLGGPALKRNLYLWHDFKRCAELVLDCDIGMISPTVGPETFPLRCVSINSSHPPINKEFVEYLGTAPELRTVRLCWNEACADLSAISPQCRGLIASLLPSVHFSVLPPNIAVQCRPNEAIPNNLSVYIIG